MEYDFKNSIGMLTTRISKVIAQRIEEKFNKKGFATTNEEWAILSFLNNHEYYTQNELGEILNRNKVYIKRLVDDLETQKLVRRETLKGDKRHNKVIITPLGSDRYKTLLPIVKKTMDEVFYDFNEIEINTLLRLLRGVAKNLS